MVDNGIIDAMSELRKSPGGTVESDITSPWRKGTRSMADGHCIEVCVKAHRVMVRDSKAATGPHLEIHPEAWSAFTGRLKDLLG